MKLFQIVFVTIYLVLGLMSIVPAILGQDADSDSGSGQSGGNGPEEGVGNIIGMVRSMIG